MIHVESWMQFHHNTVSRMKKKKILIVEDQLIITMDLEYMLQELGYEVCGICTSYDNAISCIKTAKPDLILVDIILYGEDRKSTRLNSSHVKISYAVFCLKKKRY